MLINKSENPDKFKSDKMVIGYDLGNKVSQISYCCLGNDEPETLSVTAGTKQFNIPTVLCKRKEVGQWFYGKEAFKCAESGEGILVDNILEAARKGEPVYVEETEYDPIALLTLFVKRSFALLSIVAGWDNVTAVMFTCDNLDGRMIDILTQMAAGLGLKNAKVSFQSNRESFYYYMIYQAQELWNHQVLLCDYTESYLKIFCMECNRRTTPKVVYIECKEYPFFIIEDLPQDEYARKNAMTEKDRRFLDIVTDYCEGRIISSVYLIGDGFKEEWMSDSIKYLCKGRRVFGGNNLYSKGACLGMKEKLCESDIGKKHVFLGEDKLKANIGMNVVRRGVDSYFALLDAGQNWFDAAKECDFILEKDSSFEIRVTPLNGRDATVVEIMLDGLAERPEKTCKIHMDIYLKDVSTVVLRMEDMGFGEFFPSTGRSWVEEFKL